jgi:hypothetical protein
MSAKVVQLDMIAMQHDPVLASSDIVDKIILLDQQRIQKQIEREQEEKKYNIEGAIRGLFARDTARHEDMKLMKSLVTELYLIMRNMDDRLNRVVESCT